MKILYKMIAFPLLAALLMVGCGEEEKNNFYPDPVFFEVNATSVGPDNKLNSVGEYKEFRKNRLAKDQGVGFGGLLVVCSPELLSGTTFYHLYAYDLACPHERLANVRVVPNSDGEAVCEGCGSVYSLFGGNVKSGKSETNLVRYFARPDSQSPGIFTITK